jgi:hypothetical protein
MGRRTSGLESHISSPAAARAPILRFEKVYVCLVGSVAVVIDGVELVLNPTDSCTVAPNEVGEIVKRPNHVATTLVVMPYPPA